MIKKRGTFKNLSRIKEIFSVLKKHGLVKYMFKKRVNDPEKLAKNIKDAFEELGPVFIKLGQFLSINYLVIPEVYRKEFESLQDNVQPIPFAKIRNVIEREFRRPLRDLFEKIEEKPIASASLAQVHRAKLTTGEIVVVKVQRPGVEEQVEKDLSALRFIANRVKRNLKKNGVDTDVILDELEGFLEVELDYSQEAVNADLFKRQEIEKYEKIPLIFFHTSKVIVEEYINGIKISDVASVHKAGISREKVVENLTKSIVYHMFSDGLYHGDLHPANMLVLKDGRIGFIDFGVAGKMPSHVKNMYLAQYNALFENNAEKFIEAHAKANGLDIRKIKKYKKIRKEMQELFNGFMEKKGERAFDYLFKAYNLFAKYKVPQRNEFLVSMRSTLAINNLIKQYGMSDKRFEPIIKQMIMIQSLPIADKLGPSIMDFDNLGKRKDDGNFQEIFRKFTGGGMDMGNGINPLMMVNDFTKEIGNKISSVEGSVEKKLKGIENRISFAGKFFGWVLLSGLLITSLVYYNKLILMLGIQKIVLNSFLGLIGLILVIDIFRTGRSERT